MLKNLFVFNAAINTVYGVALVLATPALLSLYGLSTDRTGTYLGGFLGATFVGLAWINWSARDWPDGEPRRALVRADFIGPAIGFFVAIWFQLQPGATPQGWVNVALTLFFAVAFGYQAMQAVGARAARPAGSS